MTNRLLLDVGRLRRNGLLLDGLPEPKEENLEWVAQMGVDHAVTWTDETKASAEYYRGRRELYARYGITLYSMGNRHVHNQDALVLGLENRDAKGGALFQADSRSPRSGSRARRERVEGFFAQTLAGEGEDGA